MITGWPPSVFLAYTPWWPEVDYIGRIVLHHPFPFSSHPLSSPVPVSTSLTPTIPVYLTLGHVIFCFRLLFIHDPSSIKAALFLYYTSVLILTKILTILSLWDVYQHPTERSYEIEGPRLPAGATHKLKPSPSTQPEPWSIGFLCGSVLNIVLILHNFWTICSSLHNFVPPDLR